MFCTDTHLILCVYLDVCTAKIHSTETDQCQVQNTAIFAVSDQIIVLDKPIAVTCTAWVVHHPIKCEQNHVIIVVTILGGGPFIIISTINAIIVILPCVFACLDMSTLALEEEKSGGKETYQVKIHQLKWKKFLTHYALCNIYRKSNAKFLAVDVCPLAPFAASDVVSEACICCWTWYDFYGVVMRMVMKIEIQETCWLESVWKATTYC